MELYFLRHGDAGSREDWKGNDTDRPLSREGAARMQREAQTMARLRLPLERIVTSPLVRARQTAEIVARTLRLTDALEEDDRLAPGFAIADLRGIVRDHRAASALMLVGHEPDFSIVIAACTGGGRVECKKGSLARVDIPAESLATDPAAITPSSAATDSLSAATNPLSGAGVLVWLLPPRVLAPSTFQ